MRKEITSVVSSAFAKTAWRGGVVLASVALLLSGCAKEIEYENNVSDAPKGTLSVGTRATDSGNVSYPVNVYVFDDDGACAATAALASSSDELSIYLPIGTYSVRAVGGASPDDYELPTKDNAVYNSPVTLLQGHSHGELMTAVQAFVKVNAEDTNSLSLSMSRKMMQLCGVTMKEVPADVTAVSVSISPLYKSLLLNGEYSGDDGSFTTDLVKDADGTTWKMESSAYLLEARGKAAITVSMTIGSGTKTFSYESADELKANYKINITGTYKPGGFTVGGTVTGTDWAGTHEITFDMTDNSGGTESKNENTETALPEAPQVGTIYMGKCLVLENDTDKVAGTITSTLMTIKEKSGLTTEKSLTQEEWETLTSAAVDELAVDDIPGWRLPTEEEVLNMLTYVKANINAIKDLVTAAGGDIVRPAAYTLFRNDAGLIKMVSSIYKENDPSDKAILRAFTTETFQ